jgi:hypothetical protein
VGSDGAVTFSDVACPKHKKQSYQKADSEHGKPEKPSPVASERDRVANSAGEPLQVDPEISNSDPVVQR